MGAKNKNKIRKSHGDTVEVVHGELFRVFKPGSGKPSLDEAYLAERRDGLIWQIEPAWHEIGRALETARDQSEIRKAFEAVASGGRPADYLAPVLRVGSEPATSDVIEQTRKKLGEVNARLHEANDEHQGSLQAYQDSERALSLLSETFERDLQRDLTLRQENIRAIKIQITDTTGKIRGIALQRNKAGKSQAREEERQTLQSELDRLETDLAADVAACIRLQKCLAGFTLENRQIVSEEASKRKEKLDAATALFDEVDREQRELQTTLADQEAFYFREQILRFVEQCNPARSTGKQRYVLTPRNLANAIAGLPYITARHSAEMCAELQTTIPEMRNYGVFVFVKSVWNRRDERGALSLTEWFKREITKLPKFELAEREPRAEGQESEKEEIPNHFRIYLAEQWYYLKKGIEGLAFHNLKDDQQQQILGYKLMVYFCSGTGSEKLDWFRTINIAGEEHTDQELRNAVYAGPWTADAKKYFSKTGCPAYGLASDYLRGSPIRQEYLETAIDWQSKGKIEDYMSEHQHDKTQPRYGGIFSSSSPGRRRHSRNIAKK